VFERRDPAWVREINNPPVADVIYPFICTGNDSNEEESK
jgi:hypothetical protein